ncbi:MAG TPA: protein kinase [Bryobacteraceae bacterium]|nr:protein kinase [Bryobacteraceae bacterium]
MIRIAMNQEFWGKVEALFLAALERSPETRRSFLDTACKGDADLRAEVEFLLSNEKRAGSFLEVPPIEGITVSLASLPVLSRQFGTYRIVSPLGAGGMGEVYRAHDSKLGRDVAIKILPPEFARDPERVARFRREARTLASLNHPNIAAIYELVEDSGETDCLVLELVEGETLRGPMPVPVVLDYAHQVAEALEAAHRAGIIHRDLKPANVKVTPQGRVKVLDFGLAKAIWGPGGRQELSQTATGTGLESIAGHIVGTPAYMSPEQARGTVVDQRTDIWAFGCLLYELLTGQRAFQGETLQDTIAAVLEQEPDWQALPARTPAKIRELLRRCLQRDADQRPHHIADARRMIENAQRGWNRWRLAAIAAAALATVALGAAMWSRNPPAVSDRSQWVQLTRLPDSVSQPALSADGKMVTFIRGPSTFFGPGQIYVKILPDGQAVQLTDDDLAKMSPVFSPDGTRIAYTSVDPRYGWDTWTVSPLGGAPQRWLQNASGLIWTGPRQVLFSEFKKPPHMAIVAAEESRMGQRDIYLPAHEHAMAHRSYASPDGKWVLLVEMDKDHLWSPCRVVPSNGGSPGRQVGPSGAACTFGAWSPDGKWVYLTAETEGAFHTWRQRFPEGKPEQMTFGPTEEEGIALMPDGRSFVTAVGMSNVSIWVHSATGDRQISLEGNAVGARFTADGRKLCYRIVKGTPTDFRFTKIPGEIWIADVDSGRSELLVPGFQTLDYDISKDGKRVVMEVADDQGKSRLWLASSERRSPPQQIPNVEGRTPRFGPTGEIFFLSSQALYRVREVGTAMRKAVEQPILIMQALSPDGRWIVAWAPLAGGATALQAFPLNREGPSVVIMTNGIIEWSPDGRFSIAGGLNGFIPQGRSHVVPLPPGQALPAIPASGFRSEQEIARLPGARKIEERGWRPVCLRTSTRSIVAPPSGISTESRFRESGG